MTQVLRETHRPALIRGDQIHHARKREKVLSELRLARALDRIEQEIERQIEQDCAEALQKGMFVKGLSQDQRDRARAITNYARQVCRKEVEKADVIEIIAGKALCDAKELA